MPSLPTPDLFVAALGRSGSTMFANLLTVPPTHWLIIEPRFADATTGIDALRQAQDFGLPVTDDEWNLQDGESPSERITRVFAPPLRDLTRWGLKEVRPALLRPTLETLRPEKTIILVRDIRDAAVSLVEKVERDQDPRYDDEWLRDYLTRSPAAILDLAGAVHGTEHLVVRYEDLVAEAAIRERISAWLDWPTVGAPERHLAEIYSREREVALHGGLVTTNSLDRFAQTTSSRAREVANWAHGANSEFQASFGYV